MAVGRETLFAAVVTAATVTVVLQCYHRYKVARLSEKWHKERQAERKGRIRAEVKLRNHEKVSKGTKDMSLTRIGTVVSPYTKRMGTPRQGALVPSSRGFIEMDVPMETIDGMESYSHAWIIFEFHANTDLSGSKKTKIRPPRAGGLKVGQLATRSPHRPNPLGLSLVALKGVDLRQKRLHIAAFDLVNGTPVYDIKPCVPWDVPGHWSGESLRVPEWVRQEDSLSKVVFSESAKTDLLAMIHQDRLRPLYNDDSEGFDAALKTLQEVLAQDPRASHTRGKATKHGANYSLVFCRSEVEFRVDHAEVLVLSLKGVDFHADCFVDGVPLVNKC